MERILAIDPGNTHSGVALIQRGSCAPLSVGKLPNGEVLDMIRTYSFDHLSIEMVASYGMAVGKEVFDTCVWIGRFVQCNEESASVASTLGFVRASAELVYRRDIKLHHCGAVNAKDSNITQALIDRFAYGQPNRGKGTKANPGWFYGFSADIWQAYALAVYTNDNLK